MIPKQLQNPEFRFILLRNRDKRPLEVEWQTKNNYSFDNPKLTKHISSNGNFGIIGGFGNLIILDADSKEIDDKCKLLPTTFKVKTGSPEVYKNHYFFITEEEMKPIRLSKEKVGDIGDIRSTGQYVVAPGSIHPSGGKYEVVEDNKINKVGEQFLKSIFKENMNLISSEEGKTKNRNDNKIDTKKRLSEFTKNCNVPDYVLNNKMPENISKNQKLFPYVIDVLNARDVSPKLYETLAEKQDHNIGAVKGWVKSAEEGTLAKTSCKKMMEYLEHYTPELVEDICGGCKLYKKIKEEREKKKEEELKEKLFEEHKEKIINDEGVQKLLRDEDFLEIIDKEFDKKIVREHKARKTIFMVENMSNVSNLGKATDNIMINAPSGVGKDHISEAIFEIFPEEEKEELIRTTPKVLAYTRNKEIDPEATWKKVKLRLEDVGNEVLNDDCFKVMSSANPNKTNQSKSVQKGKVIDILIDGKPSICITIANANPKEELLRRYPICNLDEGVDQTKEILKRQAKFAQIGKSADYDETITNALRCLKRIKVKVPFADKLVKIFCPENAIVRTHFPRFLDYIKSSCSLYQFQRKEDEEGYFIAEKQDYTIARMMLIKTTSNILMIPLTDLQKKIMGVFEENNLQKKSIDDLEEFEGIKKINIDTEWLRRQVKWLTSKGFLIKDTERRENEAGKIIAKPVHIFSYNKMQELIIPEWNEISSFTPNSKISKNSSVTSNTIDNIEKSSSNAFPQSQSKTRVNEQFEVNFNPSEKTDNQKITELLENLK